MPRRRALNVLAGALTGGSVVALSPTNAPAQRSPAEAELAAVRARLEAVETSRPLKVDLPVNVKDYGAVGNGIADDTAAIQAAVDALGPNVGTFSSPGGGTLYFPPGTYKVSGTISSTMIGWLVIEGSGIGSTSVQQTVDADLFSFQMSAGSLTVRNILLQARTGRAMSTGAAIKVGGTGHLPSVVVHDVMIRGEASEFRYGVHLTNGGETRCRDVLVVGIGGITGFYITSGPGNTAAVGPHKLISCSLYSGAYGVRLVSTTKPGVEGVQITNCDWVGVQFGVHAENNLAGDYFPPQIAVIGGHVNSSDSCIYASRFSQLIVQGGLFYNSGTKQFIHLSDVSAFSIVGNILQATAGEPQGMLFDGPTSTSGPGTVTGNVIELTGAKKYGMKVGAINGLTRFAGNVVRQAAGFMDAQGVMGPQIVLDENSPADATDSYEAVSITDGNRIDLGPVRSDFIHITTPDGAATITTIDPRRNGETFTLNADSNLVTIAHTRDCILRGAANYRFEPGSNITLRRVNGVWREISRSTA